MKEKHTFVICAYGESPYLEECICSLLNQKRKSPVLIATSTPNEHIERLAEKYHLQVKVNQGEKGISADWNFACSCADTPYVTLAHQDDLYEPDYSEHILAFLKKAKHPLIAFTDYCELRDGRKTETNELLRIKRFLLSPLKIKGLQNSKFVRRRILSVGSPICCPSVTLVKEHLPEQPVFENNMKSNVDWQAWEKLSKLKGSFIYCKKPLVAHRIHEDSETSAIIADNKRSDEDEVMFSKFWPKFIVKILVKFYAKGQDSNNM